MVEGGGFSRRVSACSVLGLSGLGAVMVSAIGFAAAALLGSTRLDGLR
ncbi:MAG: hypothetical protein QW057_10965 [Candidatus Bathyarchaeia archaeon]